MGTASRRHRDGEAIDLNGLNPGRKGSVLRGIVAPSPTRFFRRFLGVSTTIAALALGGCVLTTAGDTRLHLSPAPVPAYRAGDAFQFSGGRLEVVAEVGGNDVVWQNERGGRDRRNRNFIIDGLGWKAVPSYQVGRAEGPDTLWPLEPGRTATFITPNDESERTWRCAVTSALTTDVPAGRFDAFRVRCVTGWEPDPVDERIWYFAPDLGHYVVYVLKRDGEVYRRHELIATEPDLARMTPADRQAYDSAFQAALEKARSGTPVKSVSGIAGGILAVTPTATFRESGGRFCRRYVVTLGGTRSYPGLACRDGDGIWRIAVR